MAFLLDASALASPSESSKDASFSASPKTAPMSDSSPTTSSQGSQMTASMSDITTITSLSSDSSINTLDPPDFGIVVAHYNEDLSWLEPVIEHCKIYHKGGPKHAPKPSFDVETLENIGREGHTYLHHIVKHYDNLPSITLFTQGRVDDHISLTALEMKETALATKPGHVTTYPHRVLELFNLWDGIPWDKYPCWAKWSSPEGVFKGLPAPKTPAQYFSLFFDNFGHAGPPLAIGFQPGAIFAVRRDTIRRHPKQLYERLLHELFLGDMKALDPETGHYFERFWLAMFRPEEYCLWDQSEVAEKKFNEQGQLAKGWWHETPQGVEVDVGFTNKE